MPNILLTGGTGYLGSFVASQLLGAGHQLTVLHSPQSDLSDLRDRIGHGRFSSLVFRPEYEGLIEDMAKLRPDVVIHMASVSRGREDEAGIRKMIEANLLLPALLAMGGQECAAKGIVNCGTSWQTSGSTADYTPFNFYAATKQAAEDLLVPFVKKDELAVTTLRMFDNYGPSDRRNKVVDLIFDALIHDRPLKMSPGDQKLELVYVEDAAYAVRLAAERILSGEAVGHEVFGVTSTSAVRLRDLAEGIGQVVGSPAPTEWRAREYRTRKMRKTLTVLPTLPGWAPSVPLEDGLKRVWSAKPQAGGADPT